MLKLAILVAALVGLVAPAGAATFEVPGNGGVASGIGYISGWKCPPNGDISISIDGGAPIPIPSGVRRNDTASTCGNDGRNGYIAQINFSNLGPGTHQIGLRQSGVQFAQGTFTVATFGQSFLSGVSGTYTLQNFPVPGRTATIRWVEGAQNFVITGATGGPLPTPRPVVASQVRYGNNLTCSGRILDSAMSANGFSWLSQTGIYSPYQNVNLSSLGPVHIANSPCSSPRFEGPFQLAPGRRYSFVQSLSGGRFTLTQFDDGDALSAGEVSAQGEPAGVPLVTVYGEAADGAVGVEALP